MSRSSRVDALLKDIKRMNAQVNENPRPSKKAKATPRALAAIRALSIEPVSNPRPSGRRRFERTPRQNAIAYESQLVDTGAGWDYRQNPRFKPAHARKVMKTAQMLRNTGMSMSSALRLSHMKHNPSDLVENPSAGPGRITATTRKGKIMNVTIAQVLAMPILFTAETVEEARKLAYSQPTIGKRRRSR